MKSFHTFSSKFQVFLKYELNPTLNDYNAFVVSMKGTTIQLVRASCSNSYLRDLVERKLLGLRWGFISLNPMIFWSREIGKSLLGILLGLFAVCMVCWRCLVIVLLYHKTSLRVSRTMRVVICTLFQPHILKNQVHAPSLETKIYHGFLYYRYLYSIASKPYA